MYYLWIEFLSGDEITAPVNWWKIENGFFCYEHADTRKELGYRVGDVKRYTLTPKP